MKVNEAFRLLEREKLTVVKNNIVKGVINASVQNNKIFTSCVDIPIEKDDILIRKLPNGVEEMYNVVHPVYYNGFAPLQPHYELEVTRMGLDNIKSNGNVYNINANKVNIDSIDNSLNLKNDSVIFDKMLATIRDESIENKNEIISAINQMKESVGKPSFKNAVNDFIRVAANCILLFKEYLPLLMDALM